MEDMALDITIKLRTIFVYCDIVFYSDFTELDIFTVSTNKDDILKLLDLEFVKDFSIFHNYYDHHYSLAIHIILEKE